MSDNWQRCSHCHAYLRCASCNAKVVATAPARDEAWRLEYERRKEALIETVRSREARRILPSITPDERALDEWVLAGGATAGHSHEWHYLHDEGGLRIFQCRACKERQARNSAAPTVGWRDEVVEVVHAEGAPPLKLTTRKARPGEDLGHVWYEHGSRYSLRCSWCETPSTSADATRRCPANPHNMKDHG